MRLFSQSLAILLLSLVVFLPAHAGHSPPTITLRVHIQTSGDGLSDTQATSINLPPNGELIQIRALPEVSEKDLIAVHADSLGSVALIFGHRGRVNLDASTGENQGRILVVLLNGEVIYAPVIDEQITNGELVIPHPLPPEIVQQLQAIAQQNVKEMPH